MIIMSKGKWLKVICQCGACKKCKDRARQDKIRAGTWKPRQPKGRARELAAQARKAAKAAKAEELRALKEAAEEAKKAKRALRERRNRAFSHYVRTYGMDKARYIAACIEKKKRGEWIYTTTDHTRSRYRGQRPQ